METSILESIGTEITGVMSPVSICMLLVVVLVYTLSSSSPDSTTIRTAANLVYLETPSDTTTQKLEGALLNAAVFIVLIAIITFLLVLLYYYNFTNFLKNYMRFSAFFVLGSMGGAISLSVIQHFSIPIDAISCFVVLFNFTVVGVLSVFSRGFPILLRQGYMVVLGIIVATWFTKLPEWTTWALLVALALYDLVAVLAPGGPLKILVELASSRDEELPALIYEARPTVSRDSEGRGSLAVLVAGASVAPGSIELQQTGESNRNGGTRQSSVSGHQSNREGNENRSNVGQDDETSPLVLSSGRWASQGSGSSKFSTGDIGSLHAQQYANEESEIVEETSPLVEIISSTHETQQQQQQQQQQQPSSMRGGGDSGGDYSSGSDPDISMRPGIKLGLGDFVFYSVLVGRAAMYDLMTVYACYLAIISGLGCTLILLAVCHKALPALPISITLGVMFYFLTRLLMEPFVVGISMNLIMF